MRNNSTAKRATAPTRIAALAFQVRHMFNMNPIKLGPLFARVGGLYLMFLLPVLDAGLAQSVMFDAPHHPGPSGCQAT